MQFLQAFSMKYIFQELPGLCAGAWVEHPSLGIEPGFMKKHADEVNGFVTGKCQAVTIC